MVHRTLCVSYIRSIKAKNKKIEGAQVLVQIQQTLFQINQNRSAAQCRESDVLRFYSHTMHHKYNFLYHNQSITKDIPHSTTMSATLTSVILLSADVRSEQSPCIMFTPSR